MSSFAIEVDATALFYRSLIVIGAGAAFRDSRQVIALSLAPGRYPIQVQSGTYTDFAFTVTEAGTVDYDPVFDGCASGRGGTRLTLTGLEIGIDARGLSNLDGGVVLLAEMPFTNDDWIGYRRIRLLPQGFYAFQQGSGVLCDPVFALGADGLIRYTPEQDITQGGCLEGAGTDSLRLHGFPLRVDASAVSRILAMPNLWGLQPSFNGALDLNVLPATWFSMQLDAGVSDAAFKVDGRGVVSAANNPADLLMQVEPGPPPLLRVLPPQLPAPGPLTDAVYDFGSFRITVGSDAQGAERVTMTRGSTQPWQLDRRWLAGSPAFVVRATGNVRPLGQPAPVPTPRRGQLLVTLSGSRWPGTGLSADFSLLVTRSITPDGVDIGVTVHWTLGRGSFTSDAAWDGSSSDRVTVAGPVSALGPAGALALVGAGPVQATFRPGSLTLDGAGVAQMTGPDGVLACRQFAIDAVAADTVVLLDAAAHAPRRSAVRLQASAPWPIALPALQTPLGPLVRLADRFDSALVELGENLDGRRRQALQFAASLRDSAFRLSVAGLPDAHAQPLSVDIGTGTLFVNHDSEPPRARLRGLGTTDPIWTRAHGVALLFRSDPFALLPNLDIGFDGSTVTSIGLSLGFAGVALPLEGCVTEPLGPPSFIELLPPGSAPDPLRQRNAVVCGAAPAAAAPLLLRDFAFALLRPQDLLRLRVDVSGRRLRARAGQPPWLEAEVAGVAGALVVGLAPQHRAEQAFDPGVALPPLPVKMRLAGESRIALALASAQDYPLSTDFLLDWAAHELSAAPVCSEAPPPSVPAPPVGLGGPGLPQTALELPYRLLLSPGRGASFAHAHAPVQAGDWTELWHTRLAARTAVPGGHLPDERSNPANDAARALRAIWSPDYGDALASAPNLDLAAATLPDLEFQRLALTSADRVRIVDASAHTLAPAPAGPGMALAAHALTLSSQGGWLHLAGNRDPDGRSAFASWTHDAAAGRDQQVRTVRLGLAYPHGQQLLRLDITERVFAGGDANAAVLRKRTLIRPLPSTRRHAGLPVDALFAETSIELGSTPPVLLAPIYPPGARPDDATVAWVLTAGGEPFAFPMRARDHAGQPLGFNTPVIFLAWSALQDPAALDAARNAYNAETGRSTRTLLNGQRLAFAAEQQPGDTSFETRSIDFAAATTPASAPAGELPFYAAVAAARIELSAARALASSTDALAEGVVVRLAPDFVARGGFDAASNAGEAFLQLIDAAGAPTSIPIGFSGDKALGVASPSMGIAYVSRSLGTLPEQAGDVFKPGATTVDLKSFFPASATLLGSIKLGDLVGSLVPPPVVVGVRDPGGPSEVPLVKSETVGDGADRRLVTRMAWQPRVADAADPVTLGVLELRLNARGPSSFTLESTHTTRLDPSAAGELDAAVTQGRLTAIDLAFAKLVTLQIDELAFTAQAGHKPDTRLRFAQPPMVLGPALDALTPLLDALKDVLGGGVSVDVNAQRIVAGYAIAVPSVSIGIFSLSNIAIGIAVTVPLVEARPISFRFDFAQQQNPFNLTVSLLGGGGWFSIAVDSGGIESIDFAIEAGASVALDLAGLASGSAHVMLGASFHYDTGSLALGGYLRAGGELTVLGLISLHVEFYAGFVYQVSGARKRLHASVSVMVEVTVACVSQSVTLTLERDFDVGGSDDSANVGAPARARALGAPLQPPGIAASLSADDWRSYAEAFA